MEGRCQESSGEFMECLHSQGLKTGSIHFPGTKAKYQGEEVYKKLVEPAVFNYSNEVNWRQSIDTVMEWFTVENLDFITLYFGEPDSSGHKFGPESTQRKNMIKQVDRTVGYLRQRIRESGLESNLNLIITSDHGMETVIKTNEIHIQTVNNFTFKDLDFDLLDYGPNGLLVPKEGKLEHVYSVLKNAHPKLHVYKKEEFPKRFHYANHSRITPLLLYSDPGYVIHGVRRMHRHILLSFGMGLSLLSLSQHPSTHPALGLCADWSPYTQTEIPALCVKTFSAVEKIKYPETLK